MLTIELVEPEGSGATSETGDGTRAAGERIEAPRRGQDAHAGNDAEAIAAVESALTDLLAAALPATPAEGSTVSPPAKATKPRVARQARRRGPRKRLALRRGVPLRQSVLLAFTAIIARARASARRAAVDPEESVHDFRKSIRRARAMVALLRPALGRMAATGLTSELRRAFRATGALRDQAILLSTLRSISSEDPARPAIEQTLQAELLGDGQPARAAQHLVAGTRALAPLPATLRVVLPQTFSVADLERGLARSVRRVHRTLNQAAASGLEADFHEWRKRVKELRYQIELLASTGSAELGRREDAFAILAEELGKVTDLIVLAAELARRQKTGSLPDATGLSRDIHQAIRDRSRDLIARGQELFSESPKDFARQALAERG